MKNVALNSRFIEQRQQRFGVALYRCSQLVQSPRSMTVFQRLPPETVLDIEQDMALSKASAFPPRGAPPWERGGGGERKKKEQAQASWHWTLAFLAPEHRSPPIARDRQDAVQIFFLTFHARFPIRDRSLGHDGRSAVAVPVGVGC